MHIKETYNHQLTHRDWNTYIDQDRQAYICKHRCIITYIPSQILEHKHINMHANQAHTNTHLYLQAHVTTQKAPKHTHICKKQWKHITANKNKHATLFTFKLAHTNTETE